MTFKELMTNERLIDKLRELNPFATMMDLATSYHKLASTLFPEAILIADQLHVNHYITEMLQSVRRRVGKRFIGESAKYLKQNNQLLEKSDYLIDKEQDILVKLISFSKEIAQVYGIKESIIYWYELSDQTNSYKRLIK